MLPILLTDFYKQCHHLCYPKGIEYVYSTWTPRTSRLEGVNEVLFFGLQAFIKEYFIEQFNKEFFQKEEALVIDEYERFIEYTLDQRKPKVSHLKALHQLGYLPISIRALPEGILVPMRIPLLTIENTHPNFAWVTNFPETLMSCELWQPTTSATIAYQYRKIMEKYALQTVVNTDFVPFQGHDFSMRGMSSVRSAMLSGMGHLAAGFVGTDTIPAILGLEKYYNADITKELVGTSIPATEHSIECAFHDDARYIETMCTKIYPSGFVSIVCDGYDFWNVLTDIIPKLADEIMARNGRVVLRPDSGDPVKIICGDPEAEPDSPQYKGAVQILWEIFSGTLSKKGYKILDDHIGLIYGDAITLDRCQEILHRLEQKGFASTNVVFGIGSFSYQYVTRDTFGFALKSTHCVIDGVEKLIFKNPKTDDGVKKSQKGRVRVYKTDGKLECKDGFWLDEPMFDDYMTEVFRDGKLLKEYSLKEIRLRNK